MEGFCRGCLIKYDDPMELLQYTEKYRRLFVYSTGLQVKRNDTITFQLCKDCFLNMKAACKFKKTCRASDKRLKSYLALKDVGDGVDFCTFLKNSDDAAMTFRLPLMSGSSTPANHKARDDDNESTCTSIRNFMTDILEGEEMPDTEARIIREVIEEEADVLDDSLDSHWLQDDASIDTDFRLDFSFSPFATPRSVNNDHYYTPKTYNDQREEQRQTKKYFTSISPARHHKANDFTEIIKNVKTEKELCSFGTDATKHEESEVKFDMPVISTETMNDFDIQTINDDKPIINLDIPSIESDKLINHLDIPSIDSEKLNDLEVSINENEKSSNNLDIPSFDSGQSIDLPSLPSLDNDNETSMNNLDISIIGNEHEENQVTNVKNFYMSNDDYTMPNKEIETLAGKKMLDTITKTKGIKKVDCDVIDGIDTEYIKTSKEIERLVDGKVINRMEKGEPCIIDRNLEKALKDKTSKEFSLDDLLVTPRVYHNTSAASTPTITNILFGEKLEINDNTDSNSNKYAEKIDSIGILDDFLQNNEEKSTNKEKVKNKNEDVFKVPMDVDEVDNGPKEKIKIIKPSSIYDEGQFDLENFFCNLCNKKFNTSRTLCLHFVNKHKIRIIKPKSKAYKYKPRICSICGAEFRDSQNYHRHLKRHKLRELSEGKIFKCEHCTLEYTTQSKLDKHKASHYVKYNNKKPGKFVCTVCGATSTTIGNFRIHERRHTNNYKYKCEVCDKGFYRKSDLTVHKRLHTGEKPFSCTFCGQSYARKDTLTKHLRLHIDDRPYECEYCNARFVNSASLKMHIKSSKICLKKRGIVDVEDIATEEVEEIKETSDVNTETISIKTEIKEELPYIDTEMSN